MGEFDQPLSAKAALNKLAKHDISRWALTGGLAIEIRLQELGAKPATRPFNDVDFIAASFDCIPDTLAHDFLFNHIHPDDPQGKTMLQSVDPENRVRVDVFRAYGSVCARATQVHGIRLVAFEDLLARAARLSWDLALGRPVPRKHAMDFLRLLEFAKTVDMDPIWQDHRKPVSPASFGETAAELNRLIDSRADLLITPEYSHDLARACARCHDTGSFRLAPAATIHDLLSYC